MIKIVHNKLRGGWYIVRGPHYTPVSGRFESKEAAQAWLETREAERNRRLHRHDNREKGITK